MRVAVGVKAEFGTRRTFLERGRQKGKSAIAILEQESEKSDVGEKVLKTAFASRCEATVNLHSATDVASRSCLLFRICT